MSSIRNMSVEVLLELLETY